MQIGYFTPPVGMNLFIASYRFRRSIGELYAATIPFMLVLLIALLLITYWPTLSLVLVR
jgi:TRAP-type C4-dicarboxylate transport system permease large subunit